MKSGNAREAAPEQIEFWRAATLDGVRVLSVANSLHRWTLFHEAYAFTLVKSGHGQWVYRRREREILPTTMMLIEPGDVHVTTAVTAPAGFETLFVDASLIATTAENCGLPAGYPHLSSVDSKDPALNQAFGRVVDTLRDTHGEALERAEAFEDALYCLFRRACETQPDQPTVERAKLARAREVLHDLGSSTDGAGAMGIGDLASAVGLTPIQLIRGFKAVNGLPPYQYLVRLRLARALRLIERGPTGQVRSLTDVALEVGFCDLAHMNKHFRRMIRMSPTAYAAGMEVNRRWVSTRRR